jgi:acyl-CoA synthetase (AMP-forming)/AMP-acid ligase II
MLDALAHRGPDADGAHTIALAGGAALWFGHRRLAIQDLSDAGRQPMLGHDGRRVIVFNGEIYNFKELREALTAEGERFTTGTDTEVILAGFRCWGESALDRFRGMFAFALFDPALGMTTVLPDMDFARPARVDGARVAEAIADWGVTNMFGSPAVLDAVARWGDGRGVRFHTLRRVLSAGAPVHPRILERFRRLLPDDARIHTPYGATEALPVATIDDATILGETRRATDAGEGVCVGRPVPGAEVEIIRLDDAPIARWSDALRLPPGAVGEITVRGEQVTRDYFDDAANTAVHKILHDDGGVRHRVGDVGYLDPDGRLWFCGRKSHRVEWEGRTLFTEQVEGPFNALAAVRRSALVKGVGGRLFLFVEPIDARSARRPERLASELRAVAAGLGLTLTFALRVKLPVDARHNAKILREVLAREVARRAPAGALP